MAEHFDGRVHFVGVPAVHDYGSKFTHRSEHFDGRVHFVGVPAEIYLEKDGQKELLALLDGLNHDWPAYHEEFAGDNYFWGPEFEAENADGFTPKGRKVEAGIYLVKVFSPDNQGKYVFVVGEKEEFPAGEIINTIKVLPKLKSDFFGKSAWSAFFNRIGLFLIIPLAIIVAVLVLIMFVIRKLSRIKKE